MYLNKNNEIFLTCYSCIIIIFLEFLHFLKFLKIKYSLKW
uniref:Uncharacterized protein n=1 Tax=viral metagenome TaxID=1070528 RepID=A0A6C0H983_9ZZZZ